VSSKGLFDVPLGKSRMDDLPTHAIGVGSGTAVAKAFATDLSQDDPVNQNTDKGIKVFPKLRRIDSPGVSMKVVRGGRHSTNIWACGWPLEKVINLAMVAMIPTSTSTTTS
jgi:hypothetical protein